MKLILHMGMPKTGSTALQSACGTHADVLRRAGILYPKPTRSRVHNLLVCQVLPDNRYPKLVADRNEGLETVRAKGQAELDRLAEDCRTADFDYVVISSEHLTAGFFRQEDFAALEMLLSPLFDEITTIIYIREPSTYYLSYLQEGLKSVVRPRMPHPLQLKAMHDTITEAFGKPPILRSYDRRTLVNGDIVDDFFDTVLPGRVAHGSVVPANENQTLSAEGMVVLNHARRSLADGREGHFDEMVFKFTNEIRKLEPGLELNKPCLVDDVRLAIIRASDELHWLREVSGITFADIDYTLADGTPIPEEIRVRPLEELLIFDPEKADLLATALTSKLISRSLRRFGLA